MVATDLCTQVNLTYEHLAISLSQSVFYLQLKGVGVVGAGGEVCMDSGTATEWSSVRRLFVITIL